MSAIEALSSLAQPTRLDVFRLLVRHEPSGLAAGQIAAEVDVPQTTLSAHLSILSRAALVSSERDGRSIVYRANTNIVSDLALFLLKDCCGGRSDICAPIIADLKSCCVKEKSYGR